MGAEPQVRRIGKYKSAGDQLLREDMSEYQKEQLTALLDDLYEGFTSSVAASRSITQESVKELLDDSYVEKETLKERGILTDLKYKDEILDMVKERLGIKEDKKVPHVTLAQYKRVPLGTFGLKGKDKIAILRASGAISSKLPNLWI